MAVCMRVLKSSLPSLSTYKNLLLTGKGVCRVVSANGVAYDRCPWEDPFEQNMTKGYIDVLVGDPADPKPELDLGGIWQLAPYAVDETYSSDTLSVLEKVEWSRNRYT